MVSGGFVCFIHGIGNRVTCIHIHIDKQLWAHLLSWWNHNYFHPVYWKPYCDIHYSFTILICQRRVCCSLVVSESSKSCKNHLWFLCFFKIEGHFKFYLFTFHPPPPPPPPPLFFLLLYQYTVKHCRAPHSSGRIPRDKPRGSRATWWWVTGSRCRARYSPRWDLLMLKPACVNKPASQYNCTCCNTSHQWALTCCDAGIESGSTVRMYSCIATRPNPIEKIMTSGCDATHANIIVNQP